MTKEVAKFRKGEEVVSLASKRVGTFVCIDPNDSTFARVDYPGSKNVKVLLENLEKYKIGDNKISLSLRDE